MSSNEHLPDKCKKRFKGVENFLRRIAFNLGNSPSQTEVKIISCIPIDVTDLQQKIISLEKELDAVKNPNTDTLSPQQGPEVHTALYHGSYSRHSSVKPTDSPPQAQRCGECSVTRPRSPPATCMCWTSDDSNPDDADGRKGIFKKQKKKKEKIKKKDKGKTQLVYYAQTSNSPFETFEGTTRPVRSAPSEETLSRAYIAEMIRKQYTHAPIMQDLEVASEFSSPVCRDVDQNLPSNTLGDSDVCSCCYGPFHNIDNSWTSQNQSIEPTLPTCSGNYTSFYDTSLYDMVPVKEKSVRATMPSHEGYRKKSPNRDHVIAQYHHVRSRPRARAHPYVINNYARASTVPNYSKRTSRKEKVRRVSTKREKMVDRANQNETSDSGCIDCGNVYIKRVTTGGQKPPLTGKPTPATSHKNAECLTSILNDIECQTTTTQSVQIDQSFLEEKKTEDTLNQIKTILQSVLTEVKTNTQPTKPTEDKATKDAVVQKGSSQGNMPGCSSILHSYTYSPYSMNPHLASCSRQMSSGPCCYPNMPYNNTKCVHNFPVFIQTPGRHMCSSCYRNSSHIPKVGQMKPANTTATNTDKERSKETEKLIKEIYKSMTANMEFPNNKDTSGSECNNFKCTPRDSRNKPLYKASVLDESMKKFVKANESRKAQKTLTPLSSLDSKLVSNTMSLRSQIVSSTDTERRLRNRRLEKFMRAEVQDKQDKIVEEGDYEEDSQESSASEEEESSSDANERVAYVHANNQTPKKPNVELTKKGLFSKMFKSVKLFGAKNKKKEEQIQVDDEEDEESDGNSDDYQTVYSQRVERQRRAPRPVRSPYKLRAHSKISYSRHMRDKIQERTRKPYLEQEYRRHWNERFHDAQQRYSSEDPPSRDTPRRSPYCQNYEARSALMQSLPANRGPRGLPHTKIIRDESPKSFVVNVAKANAATKGLAWLKKHNPGIHCGPQWKKFILEG